jgi:hypothetical protein
VNINWWKNVFFTNNPATQNRLKPVHEIYCGLDCYDKKYPKYIQNGVNKKKWKFKLNKRTFSKVFI